MIPIKNAKEVEKMRKSCRTASEILDRVSELIRPGVSTKEVDEAAAETEVVREPGPIRGECTGAISKSLQLFANRREIAEVILVLPE